MSEAHGREEDGIQSRMEGQGRQATSSPDEGVRMCMKTATPIGAFTGRGT